MADMLKRDGVPHHVLNAKYHEKEAEIIAQAGRFGAVTISTNMAGRGTDILLGGNPEFLAKRATRDDMSEEEKCAILEKFQQSCKEEQGKVIAAGGLFVLGTERHESRRIDNQLRGRAGRQGDPGASQFSISLQDDLMRIFGSERIASMMDRLGMQEDETIEHPWISKAIENAQRKVEGHNFDIRKNVIEFDDVMNQQRQTVYGKRRRIVEGKGTKDMLLDMVDWTAEAIGIEHVGSKDKPLERAVLSDRLKDLFAILLPPPDAATNWTADQLGEWIYKTAEAAYAEKEREIGDRDLRHIERVVMLQSLDQLWKDHLLNMDHVREGIGLRGYAQRDPVIEYKKEGFRLFEEMIATFTEESIRKLFHVQVVREPATQVTGEKESPPTLELEAPAHTPSPPPAATTPLRQPDFGKMQFGRSVATAKSTTVKHEGPKVGRNDPCPCGSGKKYKKCCGAGAFA